MNLGNHGDDAIHGRRLHSLHLAHPADVAMVSRWPDRHFVCLLAWDTSETSVDAISEVAERLLRLGASYFVCWGPDCGRVHDIIDEIAAHDHAAFDIPDDSCIMTTWHEDETLEQALWFFLVCTGPAQPYDESTQAALAISIGSSAWAETIRSALSDSKAFFDTVNGAA
jgi:hypothetical protein